jgi:NDP-sugar pyrophosphorylase family protein
MSNDTTVALLVGGMGTRLRTLLPSTPKPLAPIGNRPFLELVVRQLRNQGIRRLVMCTGYLAEQIENQFGDGRNLDVQIQYSREPFPLGTAGAVKLAQHYLAPVPDFLVINGDSFLEVDFHELLRFHRAHRGLISVAVLSVQDSGRYGTVQVGAGNRITRFEEKTGNASPGLVNAGVYAFNRALFEHIPQGPASLERDIFPMVLDRGVYALEQVGLFIDIGTPEAYAQAQAICGRLSDAAHRPRHSASVSVLEHE